jgi:hypothetical protein
MEETLNDLLLVAFGDEEGSNIEDWLKGLSQQDLLNLMSQMLIDGYLSTRALTNYYLRSA